MYSTIQPKRCKCSKDCQLWPTAGFAGFNWQHATDKVKEEAAAKKTKQVKSSNARKAISVKLRAENRKEDEVAGNNLLDLWYMMQMASNEKICQNCGISLSHLNEWAWRGSQHHILEKSLFTSVASNPINHLVLGYYCCHQQWHTSMLNASKMPVFEKAKEIVEILYPTLPQEEKRRVSEYYGIKDDLTNHH